MPRQREMQRGSIAVWLASCGQDLRHGTVLLRRDAGTSALIVLVLALGIGANAAVFTLLKAAFVDPLPYRDAGRLVTVMENNGWDPSVTEYFEIRARTRTLQEMAFSEYRDMQLSGTGEPVRVFAARVTASFFPLLGVRAAQGGTFLPEDNQPRQNPAVVVTDAFWRSKMGADRKAIGRVLRLDGQSGVVVGVLPAGFHFDYPTLRIPERVDIYVAYRIERSVAMHPSGSGRGVPVLVLGRLRDGVSYEQAEADVRRIARILTHDYPEAFPNRQHDPSLFTFLLSPLRSAIVGTQRGLLELLLGGAGVLLLIACANTAQLLVARSLRRKREVAIRAAVGAGRLRLVQQFLLQGLVLAVLGGVAGVLTSGWCAHLLIALLPVRSPLLASAHVDARVVAFTLATCLFSTLLSALLPAIKGSRWTPGLGLNAHASRGEGSGLRHGMIALEAALSVFLLCGAGLVTQNLWTLITTPMGFDPNHVLAMRMKLPSPKPENSIDRNAGLTFQSYLQKIQAIPGVEAAATVTGPPLRPARTGNAELVGVTDGSGALKVVWAANHSVSPDYFLTLRIPLLAGRSFREDDRGRNVNVAIVNQEFARQFGLGRDIVGKQIFDPDGPITIVGLVGNVRTRGLEADPYPEVYISSLQLSWVNTYLVVRSMIPARQLVKEIRNAVESANADQAVFGVLTMKEMIADAVSEPRFEVFLIGAFALLAMAMAAAGMFSVISYLVSQRTSEIAVRMALGASRSSIARSVLGTTVAWVGGGLVCGIALALAARSTLRSLSGAAVADSPWMYGAVALLFVLVTVVAAYIPMRRASQLDPAVALRCE